MSDTTELIKERVDMVALVSEYVPLKQAGQNFKGLCPFHQEKSPSFIVSPARGSWHCFGCSEGGDAFSFIQKIEGLDFMGALKLLAERTGIEVTASSEPSPNYRQRLFDVLALATKFYEEVLQRHKAGKKALDYLQQRGVTKETIEQFRIGYAPMQWGSLHDWLIKQGVTLPEMQAVGLIAVNQTGKPYERFRGRIMFPVQDTQGRVVAFGGRIVPWHETGNEGKYINSPETALYEKRRVVYNLNRAKQVLRQGNPCIVVEGYMDTIMLVQSGIQNVVATSGTAFTPDHIGQLSRFTKILHFAFDGDSAGWKATVSATQSALAAGMTVATVVLPDGQDPADVALSDVSALQKAIAAPVSLISLLLQQLKSTDSAADKQVQLTALLPLLKNVKNPIVQGQMVQEVATILHVPEQQVHTLLTATAGLGLQTSPVSEEVPTKEQNREAMPEWHLLGLLLYNPKVRVDLFPQLRVDMFLDSKSISLYNSLQHLAETHSDFFTLAASFLVSALPPKEIPFAEGLVALTDESLSVGTMSAEVEAQGIWHRLQRRHLMSRLNILQEQLSSGTAEERHEMLREFQVVTEALSAITHL